MASERTIVAILITTLIISTLGSITAISMFGGFKALTGAWGGPGGTVAGATNLTIQTALSINFSDDTANFGTGYICEGYTAVTLSTDGVNSSANCGWNIPNGLILENVGNQKASIIITNQNYTNALLGGTLSGYAWKWEVNNSDAINATCQNANGTLLSAVNTYVNITAPYAGNSTLCSLFNDTSPSDKLNLSFKFFIDQTATKGGISDVWTVVGTGIV